MSNPANMTNRELTAVRYLLRALCNKQIASYMGVEPCTVKEHLESARRRTGTRNRVALALWAQRNGVGAQQ